MPTFAIEELTATKIRALFQRRKGRDLFDLWLAVEHGSASIDDIVECFELHRPDGWAVERALDDLDAKLDVADFTGDLDQLVSTRPPEYGRRIANSPRTCVVADTPVGLRITCRGCFGSCR